MSRGNLDACLDFVFEREGGYVDDPDDPGGATNMGITLATLAAWRGREVSKAEVRALSLRGGGGDLPAASGTATISRPASTSSPSTPA